MVETTEEVVSSRDWKSDPRSVQILATEHWSLLASRSLSWSEAFSRATIFLTALSGAVVALALVGQSTGYSRTFVLFALILLPVVLLIGLTTSERLSQINSLDLIYLQAMNRLRHAYLEMVPGLTPYFSTASDDELASTFFSAFSLGLKARPKVQVLMTTSALINVICSVLAGLIVAIIASQIVDEVIWATLIGALGAAATVLILLNRARRSLESFSKLIDVRFPKGGGTDR